MARKYRDYSDEDIIKYAREVKTASELLLKLGLKQAGGNYYTIKRKLDKLNIDCSHWVGKAWNKDQRTKKWSDFKNNEHIKKHLIKDRGRICESCSNTEWMKNPIPLEIHHIDGDRTNNDYDNLQLVCPNCHSLTSNYRGRNVKKGTSDIEINNLSSLSRTKTKCTLCDDSTHGSKSGLCVKCYKKSTRKRIRPPFLQLCEEIEELGYCATGRIYNVTDNSIRKWKKSYEKEIHRLAIKGIL